MGFETLEVEGVGGRDTPVLAGVEEEVPFPGKRGGEGGGGRVYPVLAGGEEGREGGVPLSWMEGGGPGQGTLPPPVNRQSENITSRRTRAVKMIATVIC